MTGGWGGGGERGKSITRAIGRGDPENQDFWAMKWHVLMNIKLPMYFFLNMALALKDFDG
jgi:hypothetical protein